MAKVKIYSTPTCPYCLKLKEYLKSINVEYEDINVAEDQEAAKEMVEKSGQMGVPVSEINGEIIIGFEQEKVDAALAKGDSGEGGEAAGEGEEPAEDTGSEEPEESKKAA